MEYLPIRLNKLVQFIKIKDWQAVSRICKTEEHLINTYDDDDKDHETPLMYAAFHNAPDDIMLNMIAKATPVNLEHRRRFYNGATILHYLARFTRATQLRSALEIMKNANLRDDGGRTPLHWCLDASSNFNEHREKAMSLMMHGASISIKDIVMYRKIKYIKTTLQQMYRHNNFINQNQYRNEYQII